MSRPLQQHFTRQMFCLENLNIKLKATPFDHMTSLKYPVFLFIFVDKKENSEKRGTKFWSKLVISETILYIEKCF